MARKAKAKEAPVAAGPPPLPEIDNTEVMKIRKAIGHVYKERPPEVWMDSGVPELHGVLGSSEHGIAYGRIIECAGLNSTAKSALALTLAAIAQQEGAAVTWLDFEQSWDTPWAIKRGLDVTKVNLLQPYLGEFERYVRVAKQKPKLVKVTDQSTAEELCDEADRIVRGLYGRYKKQILVVDSIAAMLTEDEQAAGLTGQSRYTEMALTKFLGRLARKWVGLAKTTNCLIFFINQLRQSPGVAYGDPWYTMGGNAMPFYAHVRVRMRRTKGGVIKQSTKGSAVQGIQGIIANQKNKIGGIERCEIGFKLKFGDAFEFVNVADMKRGGGFDEEEDE